MVYLRIGTVPFAIGTANRRSAGSKVVIPPFIPPQETARSEGGRMGIDRRVYFGRDVIYLFVQDGTGPSLRRDPSRGGGSELLCDHGPISLLQVFNRGRGGLGKGNFHLDTLVVREIVLAAHLPVHYKVLDGVTS